MNTQLAICIPTYNRANILKTLLQDLVLMVSPYEIPIYISDNASSDGTKSIVAALKEHYPFIFYHRNKINIGADRNFENVLKMSECAYSWLLGDDDKIVDQGIEAILNILQKKSFDVVVTNGCNVDCTVLKCPNIQTAEYCDHNKLLLDLWYTMSWMSTLIYSAELIKSANFLKYYNTNFLQTAIVFDYLGTKNNFSVFWNATPLVIYPDEEMITNSYSDKILFLFLQCWSNVILSLPSIYTKKIKYQCIKNSGLSIKVIYGLRMNGKFTNKDFFKYKDYFKYITNTPIIVIYLLSLQPSFFLKAIYRLIKWTRVSQNIIKIKFLISKLFVNLVDAFKASLLLRFIKRALFK